VLFIVLPHTHSHSKTIPYLYLDLLGYFSVHELTRDQSNLTKSASRAAHSPVRGHLRGSKFVPLNSWGRGSY